MGLKLIPPLPARNAPPEVWENFWKQIDQDVKARQLQATLLIIAMILAAGLLLLILASIAMRTPAY